MASLDELVEDFKPETKTSKNNSLFIIILFIGIFFCLSGLGLYIYYLNKEKNTQVIRIDDQNIKTSNNIYIDISGAVTSPGIYSLETGSRVNDLLVLAGGFDEKANKEWVQKKLNLAKQLSDGQKIYIPFEGEDVSSFVLGKSSNLININNASLSQLKSLPRIGESTAERIIKYRESHNGFKQTTEIKNVSGIGENTFLDIKDLITVE